MKIERDFTSKEFLRFIHRNIDGTEVYFVANPTNNAVNTTCQFRVQGMQPQLWNPMNGKTEKVAQYEELNGTIKMPISLEAEGSVFVVFQPENKTNIAVKNIVRNGEEQNIPIAQNDNNGFEMNLAQAGKYTLTSTDDKSQTFEVKNIPQPLEIKGPWEVQFINGTNAPAKTTFPELISWSESKDESIKYYSGSAIYTNTITIPKAMIGKNKSLKLDLGKVAIMAEVKINGKALGILWKAPFCIDITEVAKAGKNSIEIKVVNLWVNRMIGDEQLPDDSKRSEKGTLLAWPQWVLDGKSDPNGRNTFTTWKLWKKDAALVESGLIGPVSIISEEHITLNR
ncbi:MAG: glycosylhydrolase-like jelly roll fold domain-containing protein, partial [Paludibacter sp.]